MPTLVIRGCNSGRKLFCLIINLFITKTAAVPGGSGVGPGGGPVVGPGGRGPGVGPGGYPFGAGGTGMFKPGKSELQARFFQRFCPESTQSYYSDVIFLISHRLWCWWIWCFTDWRYAIVFIIIQVQYSIIKTLLSAFAFFPLGLRYPTGAGQGALKQGKGSTN